jgi:hypothetical protein
VLAKTVKWGCVMGLLLAAMSWHAGANYQLLLDWVVCAGAILVVQRALRAKQYLWAFGFVGAVLLLNPIVPVFTPAGNLMLLLFLVPLSPFVVTFAAWIDATITLYPGGITDLHPPSEPLIPAGEWVVV